MPTLISLPILVSLLVLAGVFVVLAAWARACFGRPRRIWKPFPVSADEREFIARLLADSVFDAVISGRARGKLSEVVAYHFASAHSGMMQPQEANDVRVLATQRVLALFRAEIEQDPTGRVARALPGLGIRADSL